MRNIPQTCLASTILFHGCEFCLLCIFTHDASKGCIQPSGVTPECEERCAEEYAYRAHALLGRAVLDALASALSTRSQSEIFSEL
ncbi:hypothetical protein B0A94_24080 [Pseudomonas syringae]|nr:hypothetical protein B0A94_24080 [Pseudomonas syringae]RXU44237.1 hypothetical protein B0A90_00440 [Pseudomonas syringae]